jgi:hypothetical protein
MGSTSAFSSAVSHLQRTIEQEHANWIADSQSRFHLRFMALILAAYRTLAEAVPREKAIRILKHAVIDSGKDAILKGVTYALDEAKDPMNEIVAASKDREVQFLRETFAFERYRDDQDQYILHVTHCFYH